MKRNMKSFARAVYGGNSDDAEEYSDKVVQGNMDDEVWEGYKRALEGVLESMNSDNDLTLPRQMSEGKISVEKLEKIRDEMEEMASQEFRPGEERGYSKAWTDIISVILEDEKSD